MTNRHRIFTAATAITLLVFGGNAAAADNGKLEFDSEVRSCVAEVANHANYDDATRVQHLVVKVRRQPGIGPRLGDGYVLTINTSVFTDSDEVAVREYASYCVARGDDTLVKFRINEVSG